MLGAGMHFGFRQTSTQNRSAVSQDFLVSQQRRRRGSRRAGKNEVLLLSAALPESSRHQRRIASPSAHGD